MRDEAIRNPVTVNIRMTDFERLSIKQNGVLNEFYMLI